MSESLIYRRSILINKEIIQVWDALVNPEMTRKYMFGCDVISDWKVGSPIVWKGSTDGVEYVKGTLTDIEPGKTLSFSVFDPESGDENIPSNYLTTTYMLDPAGDKTTITVTRGDYAKVNNGKKRFNDTSKSWGFVLDTLKEILENAR